MPRNSSIDQGGTSRRIVNCHCGFHIEDTVRATIFKFKMHKKKCNFANKVGKLPLDSKYTIGTRSRCLLTGTDVETVKLSINIENNFW